MKKNPFTNGMTLAVMLTMNEHKSWQHFGNRKMNISQTTTAKTTTTI